MIFLSLHLFAQDGQAKIDSLLTILKDKKDKAAKVEVYQELASLYFGSNPQLGAQYAHRAIALTDKKNYKTLIDNYKALIDNLIVSSINQDSLLYYIRIAQSIYQNVEDTSGIYYFYNYLASYYSNIGKIDQALQASLKALQIIELHDLGKEKVADIYNTIAGMFVDDGQYDKGVEYYQKAIAVNNQLNIQDAILYYNAATAFQGLAENQKVYAHFLDTARYYYNKALPVFKAEGKYVGVALIYTFKARDASFRQEFDSTIYYYDECEKLIEKYNLDYVQLTLYSQKAQFYFEQKNYKEAVNYGEKTIAIMTENNNYPFVRDVYRVIHESYSNLGQYNKAYQTLQALNVLNDSVRTKEQLQKTNELETKYQAKQKEIENQLLKAEREVAQKNARNTNILAIGLLVALLLAIGWGYAIYQANQQKKQMNAQLEQKVHDRTQELNLANKELQQVNYELKTFNYIASHDIKEPIRNIGSFVGLIQRRIPEEIKKGLDFYFSTIKRSTSQLYTLVEDFSKYTTLSKEQVIDLTDVDLNVTAQSIKDYFQETLEEKNGQLIIDSLPTIKTSPSMLFIAIKHLVENGFKYNNSETPTVEIAYQSTDDTHQIIVSDNGIGIDEQYHERIFEMFKRLHDRAAYKGSGIGLAIVKLMVEKLNGEIQLESEVDVGSRFMIELPK
jgi:signal transduction histidine kinase